MTGKEQRRHTRVKVDKPVKFRDGSGQHDGRLADISSSGAAVNTEELDVNLEDDQELELESEAFGTLLGNVVRILDDGFAMEFDLDEEIEERLISEITGYSPGSEYD